MTFNFIKSYQSRTESFKMDIPVSMINLVPYRRSMFKTEAQLRDEKLNNLL